MLLSCLDLVGKALDESQDFHISLVAHARDPPTMATFEVASIQASVSSTSPYTLMISVTASCTAGAGSGPSLWLADASDRYVNRCFRWKASIAVDRQAVSPAKPARTKCPPQLSMNSAKDLLE